MRGAGGRGGRAEARDEGIEQGHREALGLLSPGPQLFLQEFMATSVSEQLCPPAPWTQSPRGSGELGRFGLEGIDGSTRLDMGQKKGAAQWRPREHV